MGINIDMPRCAAGVSRLVAYVTLYRNMVKAFESAPIAVVKQPTPDSTALPMQFALSLSKLPPGEYSLQVSILDPGSQKVAFWQAPVMLVP